MRRIPARERVVTVEEVFELSLRAPDVVAMQTRQPNLEGTGEIPLRRLVKEALRMRPSRLIVGEVRQEECLDLLIALNRGLPGMCTLHANSAREALVKMCTLPLLAGENVSAAFVVPTVAASVDLVVHLGMDVPGARRVREIVGVTGRVEGDVIETAELFALAPRPARARRRLPAARRAVRGGRHRPRRGARPAAVRGGTDVGALLGLVAGLGLLLIWRSGPRAPQRLGRRAVVAARRRDLLRQAGIDGVGPAQLLAAQVLCAAARVRRWSSCSPAPSTVAVCFGVFGFVPARPCSCAGCAGAGRARCARCGRRRSTTSPPPSGPGCRCPRGLSALAVRGPAELRAPFARFAARYRATGRFGDCLDALKDDLADPVGDRVCETMRVAREVGGSDLGTVLRTLSELLRADARTRAELETRQGWVVNAARLAVAAPWAVLLLLGTQSQTLRAYDSPGGTLLLASAPCVCVVAYRIMLRIGRLPEERRVLRMSGAWLLGAGLGLAAAAGVLVAVRAAPPMRPVRLGRPHRALPRRHPAAVEAAGPPGVGLGAVRGRPPAVRARRSARPSASSTGRRRRGVGAPPARRARRVEHTSRSSGSSRCSGSPPALVLAALLSSSASACCAAVPTRCWSCSPRLGGLVGGVLGRDWWLATQLEQREQAMLSEFPVVADLLALSVVAGESPVDALERVCRLTGGELARDLGRALARARSGTPVTTALIELAEQTTLESFARFLHGLVVAIERGTPLADVLRAQAVDVREVGKRALLEAGGRKEISMMVPVVFLILPVTVLFALFPGLLTLTSLAR